MVGGGGGGGRAGLLRPSADEERQLLGADDLHALYDVVQHTAPLATGPFAVVRRCVHRATGRLCVAKFSSRLRLGEDCSAELRHEVALLSRCADCDRIVRLLRAFATPLHVVMVLEYLPGGDLQALLDADVVPFEGDARRYMRQLLEALHFLHSRLGTAHLDIKPQNLVLTAPFPAGDVKLCDLEVARVVAAAAAPVRELLGTPDYVAPEILHYDPITLAADMWSCGVTAYALLTGFSPFGGESDQETFCNVARARVDFPPELFDDVSPAAVAFMRRVLVREPRLRPSAADCLRDPWIAATDDEHAAGRQGELRRFLSKSREALVERAKVGLRRGLLSQSQMSLSRSREKLYGLRSLSQSQDLLQLLGVEGGLPAPLVAAALASATSTPTLHAKEEFRGSSRVSLAALGPASGVAARLADSGATRGRCVSESAATTTVQEQEQTPVAKEKTGKEAEGGDKREGEEEEEERRFSVWQLVRAFDRHQESPSVTRKGTDALRSLIVQMEEEGTHASPNGHRMNDNEKPLL